MTETTTAFVLTWWQGGLLFIVGAFLGAVIFALWIRKRLPPVEDHAVAEKKLQAYENEVHQYLIQTTEYLQQLGGNYQQLVDHLHKGLHELGKPTSTGHTVFPHFPHMHTHHKTHHDETPAVMPKTYVDPKEHKD